MNLKKAMDVCIHNCMNVGTKNMIVDTDEGVSVHSLANQRLVQVYANRQLCASVCPANNAVQVILGCERTIVRLAKLNFYSVPEIKLIYKTGLSLADYFGMDKREYKSGASFIYNKERLWTA